VQHPAHTQKFWEVARAAREIDPHFPVVCITGAAADMWPVLVVPKSILLPKLFTSAQVVAAVSQLLGLAADGSCLGVTIRACFSPVCRRRTLIRMMLVDMIGEAGHTVVAEAGDITKAVALASKAEFDLAILDIYVGGDTVEPIASAIADRGKPFFFVSGCGSSGAPDAFAGIRVVTKFCLLTELRAAIDAALAQTQRDQPTRQRHPARWCCVQKCTQRHSSMINVLALF